MLTHGNSNKAFTDELKYNLSDRDVFNLARVKKTIATKINDLHWEYRNTNDSKKKKELDQMTQELNRFRDTLLTDVLPSAYNAKNGESLQSQQYLRNGGDIKNEDSVKLAELTNLIAEESKYELESSDISKLLSATDSVIRQVYKTKGKPEKPEDEKKKQGQQNGTGDGKPGNAAKGQPTDEELEAAKREIDESIPKCQNTVNKDHAEQDIDLPLQGLETLDKIEGYKQLESWLKKITATAMTKKLSSIEKMSDLQKVSAVEFAKPRALLMKKIVNKELYVKRKTPMKRRVHVMTDRSGSMRDFYMWKNTILTQIFESCQKSKIDLFHEHFLWEIYDKNHPDGPKEIKTKRNFVDYVLKTANGGGEDVGYATLSKLRSLKKADHKQYVLVISDGTGSIRDEDQSEEIYRLMQEKNIELKFAMFSHQNYMQTIKESDIFYIDMTNARQIESPY